MEPKRKLDLRGFAVQPAVRRLRQNRIAARVGASDSEKQKPRFGFVPAGFEPSKVPALASCANAAKHEQGVVQRVFGHDGLVPG